MNRNLPGRLRSGLLLALAAAGSGCIVIPVGDLLQGPGLGEQVIVQGDAGFFSEPKIAVIDLEGVITGEEGSSLLFPQENTVSELKAKLNRARLDSEVKAVVLRIASPGGEVTACDVIHHELARFKKQTGLPVIASIGDQGASGGYYVALGADVILANPTAIVGSIGVILQHFDLTGLLEKLGVSSSPIQSSASKDLGSLFRAMRPEERAVLQKLVDDLYARFVDVVAAGRPGLSREEILKLADGRVVSGLEAARLGLVDRAGYLTDALEEAARRSGLERPTVVRYTRAARSGANIYTQGPLPAPAAQGIEATIRAPLAAGARLYYLWRPGA